jgi:ribosome recycling factor
MTSEMAQLLLADTDDLMEKAVHHARADFASIRTGRAAPALVEKIPVDYYGSETPLQQLAGFQIPEARQLLITPYDKSAIGAIERALQQSDLGLNPSNDGISIRLTFPPLTQERRKELVKVVKHMAEEGRVAIRNVRRAARHDLDAMAKDGDVPEDDIMRAEKELDRLTHAHEAEIDKALEHKESELLEV